MNSPREVYAYHVGSTSDAATFEVRFHDGYQKKFIVDRQECIQKGCSARELLEDQIIELYVTLEGSEPDILFYFS
jgi:hypothetical protein